jgi:transcriptional regulator with XRE-family HTH domain
MMATLEAANKATKSASKAVKVMKPRQIPGKGKPALMKTGKKTGKLSIPRRYDVPGSADDVDLNTFGGRLIHLRTSREVSQEEVARWLDSSRQSIRNYESGKSAAPYDKIEIMARRFGVSATYLAFGEHAVKVTKPDLIVTVDEVSLSKSGRRITGGFVIPRALAESYVEDIKDLRVFVMSHDAALFNLKVEDRLFLDTSVDRMSIDRDIYAIEIGGELVVVRYVPTAAKGKVSFIDAHNKTRTIASKDIKVLGAVVSVLSRY